MSDIGRDGGAVQFAFRHSFGEPLKPFKAGLPLHADSEAFNIFSQFYPGLNDGTAEGIIDKINGNFMPMYKNSEAFPCAKHQIDSHEFIFGQIFQIFIGGVIGEVENK